MNSSLWSSDRGTHLKIMIVAAIASVFVTMIGLCARSGDTAKSQTQIARPSASSATMVSASEHLAVR